MKLVRVDHYRCGEIDGVTYLWAPDDTDEKKLDADIAAAIVKHDVVREEFREQGPKPPHLTMHDIDKFSRDMTVGEAIKKIKEAQEKRKKWDCLERRVTRSFGSHMRELGYIPLGWMDDEEDGGVDIIHSFAYWGHRHGQSIDYTTTDTDYTLSSDDDLDLL